MGVLGQPLRGVVLVWYFEYKFMNKYVTFQNQKMIK